MSLVLSFFNKGSKVGYIYVDEVLSEYHAFQDYNTKLKAQESEFKDVLDVYYADIQEKVEYFKKNKKKLKEPEVIQKRNEIKELERVHREMSVISKQQIDSIKTAWLEPLYKDVNDEIKIYSEEKGFDYVFGNLGNGNIMYGKKTYNVTLDIIDRINVTYNKDKY
ncbi:OmpH family outer membrane protein [Hyunsoonleella pacifica]|uniref:OmpH family outer membrane protein n=1 Tax=Hyunsoonleella pacifica TaxID=1080224 RepID=UPI0013EF5AA5|nr:OmpH family outer membrane protein [Hyunsoonleella pacifica]